MTIDLVLQLNMQDGTARISIFWVNMLKHHYPKLIEHEHLGQAHSDISFDRSNSFGTQKINEIWLLT